MNDFKQTEDRIRQTKPELKTPVSMDSRILLDSYAAMGSESLDLTPSGKDMHRRILMKNTFKFTAAAIVLIGVSLLFVFNFGTSVAFAQVLENIQRRGYTFTQWIETDGQLSQVSKGTVLEPGLLRWEMGENGPFGAAALVFNVVNKEMMWISKNGSIVGTTEIPEDDAMELWMESVVNLWGLKDGDQLPLGEKKIDNKKVTGFQVVKSIEEGQICFNIWVNDETELPEELEIIPISNDPDNQEDFKLILKDFDYAAVINPALFMPTENQSTDKLIIQVGESIGDLRFGMTVQEMKEILGEPDLTLGDTIFQYQGFAITTRDQKINSIVCGDSNPTDSTILPECNCETAEGVRIGSSEDEVISAYGEPSIKRPGTIDGSTELIYREMRMRFTLYNDEVSYMYFGPKD